MGVPLSSSWRASWQIAAVTGSGDAVLAEPGRARVTVAECARVCGTSDIDIRQTVTSMSLVPHTRAHSATSDIDVTVCLRSMLKSVAGNALAIQYLASFL